MDAQQRVALVDLAPLRFLFATGGRLLRHEESVRTAARAIFLRRSQRGRRQQPLRKSRRPYGKRETLRCEAGRNIFARGEGGGGGRWSKPRVRDSRRRFPGGFADLFCPARAGESGGGGRQPEFLLAFGEEECLQL